MSDLDRRSWYFQSILLGVFAMTFASIGDAQVTPPLLRDAHLFQLGSDSVVIRWRTEDLLSSQSVIEYGTDPEALDQIAYGQPEIPQTNATYRDHTVSITGLTSETTYYYRFGTVNGGILGGGDGYRFTTSAPIGSSQAFSAWVVGDSGTGDASQRAVRDAMIAGTVGEAPHLFLHVGDIAYEAGLDQEYTENFFDQYRTILRSTPFWPSRGNHDADSSLASTQSGPYFEAFVVPTAGEFGGAPSGTQAYYSFDHHNVHFIVLNSADGDLEPPSTMLDWLEADLASTLQEWIVAVFHHPPYSKGSHDSDSGTDSAGRLVLAREYLLPILEAGGVDLVLSGHSHGYERSRLISGVYGYGSSPNFVTPELPELIQDGRILDAGDGDSAGDGAYMKLPGAPALGQVCVVAGHGGRSISGDGGHPVMVREEFQKGSCILHVDGDLLWFENIRIDGAITDQFVISKGTKSIRIEESIEGVGKIQRTPDRPLYEAGESVALAAEAPPGWVFDHWSGALSGVEAVQVVTLNSDTAVTAHFRHAPVDSHPPGDLSDVGFVAFNDFAWTEGQQDQHVSTITTSNNSGGFASTGELIDREFGLATGVTLTVHGGFFAGADNALELSASPLPGTDAWQFFDQKLDSHGSIEALPEPPPVGDLELELTGLQPTRRYELIFYSHRGDFGWDQASLVTLVDVAEFSNESSDAIDNPEPGSQGSLFTGSEDPTTRLPAENSGGYVARFTQIDPGSDGSLLLRISFDGDPSAQWVGKYANALCLIEYPTTSLPAFVRGDVDPTGFIDVGDVISILQYLFTTEGIHCLESADVDGSMAIDVGDAIFLLNYLFVDGSPPAAPFPNCGSALNPILGCSSAPACP